MNNSIPWIEIIVIPCRGIRFRYGSEGRNGAAIHGINSTRENKTFIVLKLHGFRGKGNVFVEISCVCHNNDE